MVMTSSSIFAFCTRMLKASGSHTQSFVPDQHVSKLHFGARALLPVHLSSHIELSFCYESYVHRCPLLHLLVLQGTQFARVKYQYNANGSNNNNKSGDDAVSTETSLLSYKWLKLCSPLKLHKI